MTVRPEWEDIRIQVMEDVQIAKFSQYPDLAKKLVDTGDAFLEYNNTCGDTYWGLVDGVGENNLGKVLMRVRDKFASGEIKAV